MRRTTMIVLIAALMVALTAGVAVAASVTCGGPGDTNPAPVACQGTPNNDVITGTGNADIIDALAGKDVVKAKNGDDDVNGQGNDDTLFGHKGCDTLNGGGGQDKLDAKNGDDCPSGETVDADDGNPGDKIVANDGNVDTIFCNTGDILKKDNVDIVNGTVNGTC